MLDMATKTPHLVWAMHELPHDVFSILALKEPAGGVLALAKNAVVYIKDHGPSFYQMLNPAVTASKELKSLKIQGKDDSDLKINLTGCSAVVLTPYSVLIATRPSGRLYLANLVLSTRDIVSTIVWTSPASAAPAAALCAVTEEFAFLTAEAQGSALLRMQMSKKKLPSGLQQQPPRKRARLTQEPTKVDAENGDKENQKEPAQPLEESKELTALLALHSEMRNEAKFVYTSTLAVADGVPSFGPIESLVPWHSRDAADEEPEVPQSGTMRYLCCSGACSRGSLYVVQRAVPLESLAEFEVGTGFSCTWSFARPSERPTILAAASEDASDQSGQLGTPAATASHSFVLLSSNQATKVLQTTDEIEEISKACPLDANAPTVCAGSILQNRFVVQVTPARMLFAFTENPSAAGAPAPLAFAPIASSIKEELSADGSSMDKHAIAVSGSVCDPFVAVLFIGGTLRLYACRKEGETEDLSEHLPAAIRGHVLCCSMMRWRSGKIFLAIVTPARSGSLHIFELESMQQVFGSSALADVPAVIRPSTEGEQSSDTDKERALTDVCARLPPTEEGTERPHLASAFDTIVRVELVEVDSADAGPTLVVVALGRPLLIYRAFRATGPAAAGDFPFHFRLHQHSCIGLVESKPLSVYRAASAVQHGSSGPNGVVVAPPHAGLPALLLTAKSNLLFVHPLPGTQTCSMVALNAPCCERGFFSLTAASHTAVSSVHISIPATLPGMQKAKFELQSPIPHVQVPLQKKPHIIAAHAATGSLGIAVSDAVEESAESQVAADEDPLGDEPSIVRVPPVEATTPPLPRLQPSYELWIDQAKDLSKLGQYRFSFDADEHVLSMEWITLPGFPSPSLAVGTGVNVGEDLTSRGRVLIFSTKDRDPGILPAIYQRSQKWPVTVVGQHGSYLLVSEGFKLCLEQWEKGSFTKVAFFDGSIYITAVSHIKSYFMVGDVRKGVDFIQWKEDVATQKKELRRLSRSPPSSRMTVIACGFVSLARSLGLVVLDHVGSVHLLQYDAHSDGREGDTLLRSRASFSLGSPCRAVSRMQVEGNIQAMLMATASGSFSCLQPVDELSYRTLATLCGIMTTSLPFRCGLNPRAQRSHQSANPVLVAPRKSIEDATLLQSFLFLSLPVQAALAERMKLSIDELRGPAASASMCQLSALTPPPFAGGSALPIADAAGGR